MSIHNQWSVATVFNRYGVYRSFDGTQQPLSNTTMDEQNRRRLLIGGSARHEKVRKNCKEVADCIRNLGYIVTCEDHASSTAPGAEYFGNNHIITSIQDPAVDFAYHEPRYLYGTAAPRTQEQGSTSGNLVGYRTIYDTATTFCPEIFNFTAHDEGGIYWDQSNVMTQRKIEGLICAGAGCNQSHSGHHNCSEFNEGVSTIGNTLPNDIVYALQEFTSYDVNFHKEPEYEFYIPPNMRELHACPGAEEPLIVDELDINTCADEVACATGLECGDHCSDSSSDDEE